MLQLTDMFILKRGTKGKEIYLNLKDECIFLTVKVLCDLRPLLFGLNVPSFLKIISLFSIKVNGPVKDASTK